MGFRTTIRSTLPKRPAPGISGRPGAVAAASAIIPAQPPIGGCAPRRQAFACRGLRQGGFQLGEQPDPIDILGKLFRCPYKILHFKSAPCHTTKQFVNRYILLLQVAPGFLETGMGRGGLQRDYQGASVHRRRMLHMFDTCAFIASYACRSRLTAYVSWFRGFDLFPYPRKQAFATAEFIPNITSFLAGSFRVTC